MLLIPSLELNHGQCVYSPKSIHQDDNTLTQEEPSMVAKKLIDEGAQRLHIVDMEAYMTGEPENVDAVKKVREAFPDVEIQVAGNIKKEEHVYVWLDAGANDIILSAQASKKESLVQDLCVEFPRQIFVAIDLKNSQAEDQALYQLVLNRAMEYEEEGVAGIILTHVPNHSKISPSNLFLANRLSQNIEIPVIINGGIYQQSDLDVIKNIDDKALHAIIVGKAAHDNLSIKEATKLLSA
ncbi:MAG: HisA/HisF-related TIM barrel protein [Pseudomonadota bacterium]